MATVTINERLVPVKQYVAPATGATVNVGTSGYVRLRINPAATIAALTINLPSSPQDGDTVEISSTQIVTALTLSGGTIIGALTSMVVGGFAVYEYNSDSSQWFRTG